MKTLHTFRFVLTGMIFSFCALTVNSQNVAINATGNQADPSAMLDVSSQTAGVLIPRMNTTSRNAISSPAIGLQVFNTDCNEMNYWNGTCWLSSGSNIPMPDSISSNSPTALCASTTATYTVSAVTGATRYIWYVPAGAHITSGQGTTSVNLTWGNYSGQVCARAFDACEGSEETCLDINVSPIPPTPGNITGLASVSPGQSNVTYFIGSVSGASVYNWSVPSGATITAGVGTPAITVSYACNAVSGNISVTAGSNCGSSSPSSLAVTVTSYLAANSGSAVFGGVAIGGSPTATGGYPPYTYSWSPNSNLSNNSVANPTALCSGSTTTYTIAITDAGGCTATSSGVVVTRNLAANAGANATICSGNSTPIGPATASGGNSSFYNYSWSPSTGLSSAVIVNPTANPTSTNSYTVTTTDANGCTATSSMTLTVNALPVSTYTNSTPPEVSTAVTFTPTTTSGVTYSWTFTGGSPGTSAVQNPSVTWGSTGTYSVSLTVTSSTTGCSSTTANSITIVNPTIVTFTNTGTTTWTVPSGLTSVQVLVVAGGGGGGGAGGGGGGGVIYNTSYAVTGGQQITVTVGAGGAGISSNGVGNSGSNSVFGTLTAIGGGGGASYSSGNGLNGGSGGGGGSCNVVSPGSGTNGQGNSGGNGSSVCNPYSSGGGGGAGAVGGSVSGNTSGNGGVGIQNNMDGNNYYYGGGGGGGSQQGPNAGNGGLGGGGGGASCDGGTGGGGGGSARNSGGNGGNNCNGGAGGAGTGGGGGGMGVSVGNGGAGGSGIVMIRY